MFFHHFIWYTNEDCQMLVLMNLISGAKIITTYFSSVIVPLAEAVTVAAHQEGPWHLLSLKKNLFLFGCTRSLLRHMRSLIFIAACGSFKLWYVESSSPTRDQTWALLHWEHGIWATGPAGKPHCHLLYQDHMQLEASGGWQWRLEGRDQESLGNWDRDGILTKLSSAVSSVISWAEDWWTKGRFLKKHGA